MRKQLLALGVIATTLFACGNKNDYSGRWIGNCMGREDTVTISKDGDNYSLMHGGSKMSAKMDNDTLVLAMGGSRVTFKIDKGQLAVNANGMKCSYDKK